MKLRGQKKNRSFFEYVATASVLGALSSPMAFSDVKQLRPVWSPSPNANRANQSFLMDFERTSQSREAEFINGLIQPKTASELRQAYDDRFREFELRRRFGLTAPKNERSHNDEMAKFVREVFGRVRHERVQKEVKTVKNRAEKAPELQPIRRPLIVAMVLAGLYSGQPIELGSEEDQFLLQAQTNVPDQTGRFRLMNPVLNTEFEFTGKALESRDPFASEPENPDHRKERYLLTFSRPLPVFQLTSGLSYGSTTANVTASLSKQLSDHLTLVLGTTKSTRYQGPTEESVRFNYDLRF